MAALGGLLCYIDRVNQGHQPMATTTLAAIAALLLLPLLILLWATESRPQRARRLRSYGWTQQRIADHLGVSRSTARRLLTA
jgi:hypothetical protein